MIERWSVSGRTEIVGPDFQGWPTGGVVAVPDDGDVDGDGSAFTLTDQLEPAPVEDICYYHAATCPDCGGSMVRLGGCFSCPACGFESCHA